MAKKKQPESSEPSSIYHTMAQTEESQTVSQQLSEIQDLKQHEEAPKIAGYMILKPLGRGAYAQVWEAIQLRTRRFVAVKVFIKKGGVHWFFLQREAERLIRLDKHPNIVSLLDADLGGEIPYYVMDLAQEGSLESLMQKRKLAESGLFKVEQAADWMEQIGQALQYVHHKQMVHCDLKPANVLLDEEGHVRVADFGNSRVLSESGSALGTLFFMAPEQAVMPDSEHPIQPDARWDIYALGCTAYAMLSGHVPHEEISGQLESMAAVEDRLKLYRDSIANKPVPPLFEITKGRVDRDLSAIINKCMKPNPLDRYKSVAEVLKELKARREGKPVSPLSHDLGYWLGKFVVRYRVSVMLAALALFAALTAWFFVHQRQQAQVQDNAFNYVLRGREYLDKDDEASAAAYFSASNKIFPSLLARGNAVLHMPPIPTGVFSHDGSLVAAALSPTGKKILTAGGDTGVRLWDSDGQPDGPAFKTGGIVTAALFSPDGTKIAAGDDDGKAEVWAVESGQEIGSAIQTDDAVNALSFSPDGQFLLTGGADGIARLWDASTGKSRNVVFKQADSLTQAIFSPDGHRVVTASKDGTAQIWDASNGKPIEKPFHLQIKGAPSSYRPSLFYTLDGKTIVATGWDGSVWFYDANNGRPLGRHLYLEGLGAQAVLSPNGQKFMTSVIFSGANGEVRVWNFKNRAPLRYTLHTNGKVLAMAFSPDGSQIVAGTSDHAAWIWDAESGDPIGKTLWHGSSVVAAAFGPEGRFLITGSQDGLVRFWNLEEKTDAEISLDWKSGGRDHLKNLENHSLFSHDGKIILTYGGKTACRWDAQTGKALGDILTAPGTVFRAVFSPDDGRLLLCDLDKQSQLLELSTGKSQILVLDGAVHGGAFSTDGKTVLTGGDDKTLRLWDASNGRALGKPLNVKTKIEKVFLSPDCKKEALLSPGGSFKLYPVADNAKVLIQVDHKVQAAAFSPDNRRVVVAAGSEATLWDTSSGKLAKTLSHGHALSNVFFSPDGSRIATVGTDGTVRLWDGQTGNPVGDPLKHEGPVQDSAFGPKGQALVLAYQDGGWQVWDAKTGEPIGEETQEGVLIEGLGFVTDGTTLRLLDKKGNIKTIDSSWMGPMDPDQLLLRSRVAGLCAVDSSGSLDPVSTDSWFKEWRQIPQGVNP